MTNHPRQCKWKGRRRVSAPQSWWCSSKRVIQLASGTTKRLVCLLLGLTAEGKRRPYQANTAIKPRIVNLMQLVKTTMWYEMHSLHFSPHLLNDSWGRAISLRLTLVLRTHLFSGKWLSEWIQGADVGWWRHYFPYRSLGMLGKTNKSYSVV